MEARLSKRLKELENTQESIQSVTAWVIFYRKKNTIDSSKVWEKELRSGGPEKQLPLLYLANEIVQTSRRKGSELYDAFLAVLSSSLSFLVASGSPHIPAVRRVISIWTDRHVFPPSFLSSLSSILSSPSPSLSPHIIPTISATPTLSILPTNI